MASRLFGLLFSEYSAEDVAKLSEENHSEEYLAVDVEKKVLYFIQKVLACCNLKTGPY
jgi:hypothetical protein